MRAAIDEEQLNGTLAALANATRRAILARLAQGEATVNELAAPFDLTLPAVSKHIKVLEQAGLVTRGQRAQYRPGRLEATRLEDVATWAEQHRRRGDRTPDAGPCRARLADVDRAAPLRRLVQARRSDRP